MTVIDAPVEEVKQRTFPERIVSYLLECNIVMPNEDDADIKPPRQYDTTT